MKTSTLSSTLLRIASLPATSKPFPYRAIYSGPLVPAIPLVVHGPKAKIPVPGLIDSGADNSMFPLDWAGHLGVDLSACRVEDCSTAGGVVQHHIWDPGLEAEVQALGRRVKLNAAFCDGLPVVILGRDDFFAEFKVSFDQRAQTFTLETYD